MKMHMLYIFPSNVKDSYRILLMIIEYFESIFTVLIYNRSKAKGA